MTVLGWAHALVLSLLYLSASAYDIDTVSCTGSDLQYVQSAMADANTMASAGQSLVTGAQGSQNGNSRKLLWKSKTVYQQVANNLGTMLGAVDWTYTAGTSPLIYCNPNGFTLVANRQWRDSATGTIITTSKPQLCTGNNLATTYRRHRIVSNPNALTSIIMLCDVAPGGPHNPRVTDSSGNVAALTDIQSQSGKGGFYPGKQLDMIVGYWLTSFSLLHELMHVTQPVPITSGSAEVYGFNRCIGKPQTQSNKPIITSATGALLNADSYAYWSLSAYVESLSGFDVIDGELFVPPTLPPSRIKRRRTRNKISLWE